MKLVVFGTSEFAVPVLEAVADRHVVVGVVTQPDRPAGRGHKLVATPVKRAAEARGMRVLTPEKLKPFVEEARALGADAFVVASYGKIVPQALLDVVPIAFNVHPSMLPLYRGATPLQSAIRDGCADTGVTIIAMDAGMDTGDVLLQERAPIGPTETYGELHDRLAKRGAELVVEAVDQYANGTLRRTPQSEIAREAAITEDEIARTLTRPLRKDDLIIDWNADGERIRNLVRSLSPEPAARTFDRDGEPIKIANVHVEPRLGALRPDAIVELADGHRLVVEVKRGATAFAAVDTGDAWVVLDEVIPAGKRPMDGRHFAQMIAQVRRYADAVRAPDQGITT